MDDQGVGSNSTHYLRNVWYVASLTSEIDRRLTAFRILGDRIVVFRDSRGQPIALEDACPHRKLPLSKGRLCGDVVECGYHGLTFNKDGICVQSPTQTRIPPTARVRSYPVTDKYGLLWLWMGDATLADESEILSIENFDSPDWHMTTGDAMSCKCNYLYLTDNLLDPSHVAWVHRTSFAASGTEDTPLELEERTESLIVSRWIYDCEVPAFYAPLVKFNGRCDRLQHYEVRYPSIAINKSIFVPAGHGGSNWQTSANAYVMISYNFLTPIDECHTRYHWLQHRNTDTDEVAITEKIASGAKLAFKEDRDILEAVHEGIATETSRHINLALDAAAIRFRRNLGKRIAREREVSE